MQNIHDYGAVGDGKALDTEAIQKAIDAGGTVYIPSGVYRIGTLYLKSGGGLLLDAGATLVASHDKKDYNADDYVSQNECFYSEKVTAKHLISAVGQTNVFIAGSGSIVGEGHYWMNESKLIEGTDQFDANPERPGQMIYFCECDGVRLTGVNISDAPYWHVFFHGCTEVAVSDVIIRGDRKRWTNDGIDIDCCSGVTVSGCHIDVGDDALTLRAHGKALLSHEAVCKDVTVTNCILKSYEGYGIRIGVGSGTIRDCVLSNLSIEAHGGGAVNVVSRFSTASDGVCVENILLQNLSVTASVPFDIRLNAVDTLPPLPKEKSVCGILVENAMIRARLGSTICGCEGGCLGDIMFKNMFLRYDPTIVVANRWHHGSELYMFDLRFASGVVFDTVAADGNGPCGVRYSYSEAPTLRNCDFGTGDTEAVLAE